MAELDSSTGEWKRALRLVRELYSLAPDASARDHLLREVRSALETVQSPRLRSLARLVTPDADARQLLCVLVPLERVDSRTRITDADMELTDSDSPAGGKPPAKMPMIAVADNLRSLFNVGGLFRTADFFGFEALWLCGYTATPDMAPQLERAALGAVASVPWRSFDSIRDAIAELRRQGRRIYALETSKRAIPLSSATFAFPGALLLGSERFGLDPDVVASADACIAISASGIKNSLNVVTAFGVAAYQARLCYEAGNPSMN